MKVSAKDKRIKALNTIPAATPDEELNVKGLRPLDAAAIRACIAELRAGANITTVSTAHPEWRVHHHAPRRTGDPWSIDVNGNWRLLFEYEKKAFEISGFTAGRSALAAWVLLVLYLEIGDDHDRHSAAERLVG